jgi:hypothetical protein
MTYVIVVTCTSTVLLLALTSITIEIDTTAFSDEQSKQYKAIIALHFEDAGSSAQMTEHSQDGLSCQTFHSRNVSSSLLETLRLDSTNTLMNFMQRLQSSNSAGEQVLLYVGCEDGIK